ncbi:MAG: acyltransferase [Pseudomonadota bacterium]
MALFSDITPPKSVFVRRVADVEATRDNHFNLIRLLAAFGVLVSHAYPLALGPGAMQPLEQALGMTLGGVCVAIFFAVSGFYITRSFDQAANWHAFVLARVLRIFPALLVVLLLTVAVASLLTTASPATFWGAAPGYLIQNLTLVRLDYDLPGVFEATPYGTAINGSLWTLFYEVVCYAGVLFAGLLGLFHRPRLAFAVLAVVLLAGGVLLEWGQDWGLNGRVTALAKLGLPFVIGSAIYLFRHSVPLSPLLGAALVALALATSGTPAFSVTFMLALSYCVFLVGFWPADGLLGYNRFGDISYGVYIYAFPIQQWIASQGVVSPGMNILLAVPPTLICAMLSWHLVEKPALRLKTSAPASAPVRA